MAYLRGWALRIYSVYSYTAIQLYTLYSIQHYTASLSVDPDEGLVLVRSCRAEGAHGHELAAADEVVAEVVRAWFVRTCGPGGVSKTCTRGRDGVRFSAQTNATLLVFLANAPLREAV